MIYWWRMCMIKANGDLSFLLSPKFPALTKYDLTYMQRRKNEKGGKGSPVILQVNFHLQFQEPTI